MRRVAPTVVALLLALLFAASAGAAQFRVGVQLLRFVDHSRTIRLPDGHRVPRTLVTYVRYPALGAASSSDDPHALPATARGPFPLVVFAHGFAVTPATYSRLLHAWAAQGYVVAAPVFPLTAAGAPGGPRESDIVNEPRDMSVVISRVLAASSSPGGGLTGLVAPRSIAVAGHSDGAVTALATAYDRRLRDRRVRAAIVLSGAAIAPFTGFGGGPPLLAVQGTADTTNAPANTYAYFRGAPRPKYLLRLLGAGHLPPYTYEQPQLGIVERVTTAFLNGYLKHRASALSRLPRLGDVAHEAALTVEP